MLEQAASGLLQRLLGEYFKEGSFDPSKFELGIWSGSAFLRDLELREDALDSLQLPITVRRGIIKGVIVTIPWTRPNTEATVISIDGVYVLLETLYEWPAARAEKRAQLKLASKLALVAAAEERSRARAEERKSVHENRRKKRNEESAAAARSAAAAAMGPSVHDSSDASERHEASRRAMPAPVSGRGRGSGRGSEAEGSGGASAHAHEVSDSIESGTDAGSGSDSGSEEEDEDGFLRFSTDLDDLDNVEGRRRRRRDGTRPAYNEQAGAADRDGDADAEAAPDAGFLSSLFGLGIGRVTGRGVDGGAASDPTAGASPAAVLSGLLTSIMAKVVDNVEVHVRSVHVRWEDRLSLPKPIFLHKQKFAVPGLGRNTGTGSHAVAFGFFCQSAHVSNATHPGSGSAPTPPTRFGPSNHPAASGRVSVSGNGVGTASHRIQQAGGVSTLGASGFGRGAGLGFVAGAGIVHKKVNIVHASSYCELYAEKVCTSSGTRRGQSHPSNQTAYHPPSPSVSPLDELDLDACSESDFSDAFEACIPTNLHSGSRHEEKNGIGMPGLSGAGVGVGTSVRRNPYSVPSGISTQLGQGGVLAGASFTPWFVAVQSISASQLRGVGRGRIDSAASGADYGGGSGSTLRLAPRVSAGSSASSSGGWNFGPGMPFFVSLSSLPTHPFRDHLVLLPLDCELRVSLNKTRTDRFRPQHSLSLDAPHVALQLCAEQVRACAAVSEGWARHGVRTRHARLRPQQRLITSPTSLVGEAGDETRSRIARSWWAYAAIASVRDWRDGIPCSMTWSALQARRLIRRTSIWLYKRQRAGIRPAEEWPPVPLRTLQTLLSGRGVGSTGLLQEQGPWIRGSEDSSRDKGIFADGSPRPAPTGVGDPRATNTTSHVPTGVESREVNAQAARPPAPAPCTVFQTYADCTMLSRVLGTRIRRIISTPSPMWQEWAAQLKAALGALLAHEQDYAEFCERTGTGANAEQAQVGEESALAAAGDGISGHGLGLELEGGLAVRTQANTPVPDDVTEVATSPPPPNLFPGRSRASSSSPSPPSSGPRRPAVEQELRHWTSVLEADWAVVDALLKTRSAARGPRLGYARLGRHDNDLLGWLERCALSAADILLFRTLAAYELKKERQADARAARDTFSAVAAASRVMGTGGDAKSKALQGLNAGPQKDREGDKNAQVHAAGPQSVNFGTDGAKKVDLSHGAGDDEAYADVEGDDEYDVVGSDISVSEDGVSFVRSDSDASTRPGQGGDGLHSPSLSHDYDDADGAHDFEENASDATDGGGGAPHKGDERVRHSEHHPISSSSEAQGVLSWVGAGLGAGLGWLLGGSTSGGAAGPVLSAHAMPGTGRGLSGRGRQAGGAGAGRGGTRTSESDTRAADAAHTLPGLDAQLSSLLDLIGYRPETSLATFPAWYTVTTVSVNVGEFALTLARQRMGEDGEGVKGEESLPFVPLLAISVLQAEASLVRRISSFALRLCCVDMLVEDARPTPRRGEGRAAGIFTAYPYTPLLMRKTVALDDTPASSHTLHASLPTTAADEGEDGLAEGTGQQVCTGHPPPPAPVGPPMVALPTLHLPRSLSSAAVAGPDQSSPVRRSSIAAGAGVGGAGRQRAASGRSFRTLVSAATVGEEEANGMSRDNIDVDVDEEGGVDEHDAKATAGPVLYLYLEKFPPHEAFDGPEHDEHGRQGRRGSIIRKTGGIAPSTASEDEEALEAAVASSRRKGMGMARRGTSTSFPRPSSSGQLSSGGGVGSLGGSSKGALSDAVKRMQALQALGATMGISGSRHSRLRPSNGPLTTGGGSSLGRGMRSVASDEFDGQGHSTAASLRSGADVVRDGSASVRGGRRPASRSRVMKPRPRLRASWTGDADYALALKLAPLELSPSSSVLRELVADFTPPGMDTPLAEADAIGGAGGSGLQEGEGSLPTSRLGGGKDNAMRLTLPVPKIRARALATFALRLSMAAPDLLFPLREGSETSPLLVVSLGRLKVQSALSGAAAPGGGPLPAARAAAAGRGRSPRAFPSANSPGRHQEGDVAISPRCSVQLYSARLSHAQVLLARVSTQWRSNLKQASLALRLLEPVSSSVQVEVSQIAVPDLHAQTQAKAQGGRLQVTVTATLDPLRASLSSGQLTLVRAIFAAAVGRAAGLWSPAQLTRKSHIASKRPAPASFAGGSRVSPAVFLVPIDCLPQQPGRKVISATASDRRGVDGPTLPGMAERPSSAISFATAGTAVTAGVSESSADTAEALHAGRGGESRPETQVVSASGSSRGQGRRAGSADAGGGSVAPSTPYIRGNTAGFGSAGAVPNAYTRGMPGSLPRSALHSRRGSASGAPFGPSLGLGGHKGLLLPSSFYSAYGNRGSSSVPIQSQSAPELAIRRVAERLGLQLETSLGKGQTADAYASCFTLPSGSRVALLAPVPITTIHSESAKPDNAGDATAPSIEGGCAVQILDDASQLYARAKRVRTSAGMSTTGSASVRSAGRGSLAGHVQRVGTTQPFPTPSPRQPPSGTKTEREEDGILRSPQPLRGRGGEGSFAARRRLIIGHPEAQSDAAASSLALSASPVRATAPLAAVADGVTPGALSSAFSAASFRSARPGSATPAGSGVGNDPLVTAGGYFGYSSVSSDDAGIGPDGRREYHGVSRQLLPSLPIIAAGPEERVVVSSPENCSNGARATLGRAPSTEAAFAPTETSAGAGYPQVQTDPCVFHISISIPTVSLNLALAAPSRLLKRWEDRCFNAGTDEVAHATSSHAAEVALVERPLASIVAHGAACIFSRTLSGSGSGEVQLASLSVLDNLQQYGPSFAELFITHSHAQLGLAGQRKESISAPTSFAAPVDDRKFLRITFSTCGSSSDAQRDGEESSERQNRPFPLLPSLQSLLTQCGLVPLASGSSPPLLHDDIRADVQVSGASVTLNEDTIVTIYRMFTAAKEPASLPTASPQASFPSHNHALPSTVTHTHHAAPILERFFTITRVIRLTCSLDRFDLTFACGGRRLCTSTMESARLAMRHTALTDARLCDATPMLGPLYNQGGGAIREDSRGGAALLPLSSSSSSASLYITESRGMERSPMSQNGSPEGQSHGDDAMHYPFSFANVKTPIPLPSSAAGSVTLDLTGLAESPSSAPPVAGTVHWQPTAESGVFAVKYAHKDARTKAHSRTFEGVDMVPAELPSPVAGLPALLSLSIDRTSCVYTCARLKAIRVVDHWTAVQRGGQGRTGVSNGIEKDDEVGREVIGCTPLRASDEDEDMFALCSLAAPVAALQESAYIALENAAGGVPDVCTLGCTGQSGRDTPRPLQLPGNSALSIVLRPEQVGSCGQGSVHSANMVDARIPVSRANMVTAVAHGLRMRADAAFFSAWPTFYASSPLMHAFVWAKPGSAGLSARSCGIDAAGADSVPFALSRLLSFGPSTTLYDCHLFTTCVAFPQGTEGHAAVEDTFTLSAASLRTSNTFWMARDGEVGRGGAIGDAGLDSSDVEAGLREPAWRETVSVHMEGLRARASWERGQEWNVAQRTDIEVRNSRPASWAPELAHASYKRSIASITRLHISCTRLRFNLCPRVMRLLRRVWIDNFNVLLAITTNQPYSAAKRAFLPEYAVETASKVPGDVPSPVTSAVPVSVPVLMSAALFPPSVAVRRQEATCLFEGLDLNMQSGIGLAVAGASCPQCQDIFCWDAGSIDSVTRACGCSCVSLVSVNRGNVQYSKVYEDLREQSPEMMQGDAVSFPPLPFSRPGSSTSMDERPAVPPIPQPFNANEHPQHAQALRPTLGQRQRRQGPIGTSRVRFACAADVPGYRSITAQVGTLVVTDTRAGRKSAHARLVQPRLSEGDAGLGVRGGGAADPDQQAEPLLRLAYNAESPGSASHVLDIAACAPKLRAIPEAMAAILQWCLLSREAVRVDVLPSIDRRVFYVAEQMPSRWREEDGEDEEEFDEFEENVVIHAQGEDVQAASMISLSKSRVPAGSLSELDLYLVRQGDTGNSADGTTSAHANGHAVRPLSTYGSSDATPHQHASVSGSEVGTAAQQSEREHTRGSLRASFSLRHIEAWAFSDPTMPHSHAAVFRSSEMSGSLLFVPHTDATAGSLGYSRVVGREIQRLARSLHAQVWQLEGFGEGIGVADPNGPFNKPLVGYALSRCDMRLLGAELLLLRPTPLPAMPASTASPRRDGNPPYSTLQLVSPFTAQATYSLRTRYVAPLDLDQAFVLQGARLLRAAWGEGEAGKGRNGQPTGVALLVDRAVSLGRSVVHMFGYAATPSPPSTHAGVGSESIAAEADAGQGRLPAVADGQTARVGLEEAEDPTAGEPIGTQADHTWTAQADKSMDGVIDKRNREVAAVAADAIHSVLIPRLAYAQLCAELSRARLAAETEAARVRAMAERVKVGAGGGEGGMEGSTGPVTWSSLLLALVSPSKPRLAPNPGLSPPTPLQQKTVSAANAAAGDVKAPGKLQGQDKVPRLHPDADILTGPPVELVRTQAVAPVAIPSQVLSYPQAAIAVHPIVLTASGEELSIVLSVLSALAHLPGQVRAGMGIGSAGIGNCSDLSIGTTSVVVEEAVIAGNAGGIVSIQIPTLECGPAPVVPACLFHSEVGRGVPHTVQALTVASPPPAALVRATCDYIQAVLVHRWVGSGLVIPLLRLSVTGLKAQGDVQPQPFLAPSTIASTSNSAKREDLAPMLRRAATVGGMLSVDVVRPFDRVWEPLVEPWSVRMRAQQHAQSHARWGSAALEILGDAPLPSAPGWALRINLSPQGLAALAVARRELSFSHPSMRDLRRSAHACATISHPSRTGTGMTGHLYFVRNMAGMPLVLHVPKLAQCEDKEGQRPGVILLQDGQGSSIALAEEHMVHPFPSSGSAQAGTFGLNIGVSSESRCGSGSVCSEGTHAELLHLTPSRDSTTTLRARERDFPLAPSPGSGMGLLALAGLLPHARPPRAMLEPPCAASPVALVAEVRSTSMGTRTVTLRSTMLVANMHDVPLRVEAMGYSAMSGSGVGRHAGEALVLGRAFSRAARAAQASTSTPSLLHALLAQDIHRRHVFSSGNGTAAPPKVLWSATLQPGECEWVPAPLAQWWEIDGEGTKEIVARAGAGRVWFRLTLALQSGQAGPCTVRRSAGLDVTQFGKCDLQATCSVRCDELRASHASKGGRTVEGGRSWDPAFQYAVNGVPTPCLDLRPGRVCVHWDKDGCDSLRSTQVRLASRSGVGGHEEGDTWPPLSCRGKGGGTLCVLTITPCLSITNALPCGVDVEVMGQEAPHAAYGAPAWSLPYPSPLKPRHSSSIRVSASPRASLPVDLWDGVEEGLGGVSPLTSPPPSPTLHGYPGSDSIPFLGPTIAPVPRSRAPSLPSVLHSEGGVGAEGGGGTFTARFHLSQGRRSCLQGMVHSRSREKGSSVIIRIRHADMHAWSSGVMLRLGFIEQEADRAVDREAYGPARPHFSVEALGDTILAPVSSTHATKRSEDDGECDVERVRHGQGSRPFVLWVLSKDAAHAHVRVGVSVCYAPATGVSVSVFSSMTLAVPGDAQQLCPSLRDVRFSLVQRKAVSAVITPIAGQFFSVTPRETHRDTGAAAGARRRTVSVQSALRLAASLGVALSRARTEGARFAEGDESSDPVNEVTGGPRRAAAGFSPRVLLIGPLPTFATGPGIRSNTPSSDSALLAMGPRERGSLCAFSSTDLDRDKDRQRFTPVRLRMSLEGYAVALCDDVPLPDEMLSMASGLRDGGRLEHSPEHCLPMGRALPTRRHVVVLQPIATSVSLALMQEKSGGIASGSGSQEHSSRHYVKPLPLPLSFLVTALRDGSLRVGPAFQLHNATAHTLLFRIAPSLAALDGPALFLSPSSSSAAACHEVRPLATVHVIAAGERVALHPPGGATVRHFARMAVLPPPSHHSSGAMAVVWSGIAGVERVAGGTSADAGEDAVGLGWREVPLDIPAVPSHVRGQEMNLPLPLPGTRAGYMLRALRFAAPCPDSGVGTCGWGGSEIVFLSALPRSQSNDACADEGEAIVYRERPLMGEDAPWRPPVLVQNNTAFTLALGQAGADQGYRTSPLPAPDFSSAKLSPSTVHSLSSPLIPVHDAGQYQYVLPGRAMEWTPPTPCTVDAPQSPLALSLYVAWLPTPSGYALRHVADVPIAPPTSGSRVSAARTGKASSVTLSDARAWIASPTGGAGVRAGGAPPECTSPTPREALHISWYYAAPDAVSGAATKQLVVEVYPSPQTSPAAEYAGLEERAALLLPPKAVLPSGSSDGSATGKDMGGVGSYEGNDVNLSVTIPGLQVVLCKSNSSCPAVDMPPTPHPHPDLLTTGVGVGIAASALAPGTGVHMLPASSVVGVLSLEGVSISRSGMMAHVHLTSGVLYQPQGPALYGTSLLVGRESGVAHALAVDMQLAPVQYRTGRPAPPLSAGPAPLPAVTRSLSLSLCLGRIEACGCRERAEVLLRYATEVVQAWQAGGAGLGGGTLAQGDAECGAVTLSLSSSPSPSKDHAHVHVHAQGENGDGDRLSLSALGGGSPARESAAERRRGEHERLLAGYACLSRSAIFERGGGGWRTMSALALSRVRAQGRLGMLTSRCSRRAPLPRTMNREEVVEGDSVRARPLYTISQTSPIPSLLVHRLSLHWSGRLSFSWAKEEGRGSHRRHASDGAAVALPPAPHTRLLSLLSLLHSTGPAEGGRHAPSSPLELSLPTLAIDAQVAEVEDPLLAPVEAAGAIGRLLGAEMKRALSRQALAHPLQTLAIVGYVLRAHEALGHS